MSLLQLLTHIAHRLDRDERGATAVEYGLMVALIAAAIIITVTALGAQLDTLFQTVTGALPGGATP